MANQSLTALHIGNFFHPNGSSTFSLNASTTYTQLAFGLLPRFSKTLNAVRFCLSSITGTLGAASLTAEIQTDNGAGLPSGTNVTGGTAQPCTATPVVGFNAVSGFTCALNAYTQYWIVFKNADGSPTVNVPSWLIYNTVYVLEQPFWSTSPFASVGFGHVIATNNGTTWTQRSQFFPNYRADWSDGTYSGLPIQSVNASSSVVQSTTELGAQLTLPGPSSLQYNVAGIATLIQKSATPVGFPQCKLYTGSPPVLLATTQAANYTLQSVSNYTPFMFLTGSPLAQNTQQVPGGTVVTMTLADTATETGSNGFKISGVASMDTDANSLPLYPVNGTFKQAALSGGTWTYTAGTLPSIALLLDTTGEFTGLSTFIGQTPQVSMYWDT